MKLYLPVSATRIKPLEQINFQPAAQDTPELAQIPPLDDSVLMRCHRIPLD